MTIEQFGQKIKSKYPQYNDMSDSELGQKMLSKYPQYNDMIETTQAQQPEKKSLLSKVGDFLGVGGLAKGITSSILTSTDPQYKKIVAKADRGETLTPGERAYFESIRGGIPTNKEVIGSAIQTGATIATAGIGAGKLLPTALKVGATGTLAGFGAGLEQDKSIPDSVKQAFITGAASAATYGAFVGAGKAVKYGLEKLPIKIYSAANNLSKESGNILMNEKQIGNAGKLKVFVDKTTSEINQSIADKIKAKNGTINSDDFLLSVFSKIKNKFKGISDAKIWRAINSAGIEPFIKENKVEYSIADSIRQKLGYDINWANDTKFAQSVRSTIWKELVNTYRPATGTTQDFAKLAPLTEAAKKLGKLAEKQEKFKLNLWALLKFDFLGTPTTQTGIAVGANELNKVINKIPFNKAGFVSRTALINALKNI
jgi:hypothetical protein